MKTSEIRKLTIEQIIQKISELKTELFKLRFLSATGQLENPSRISAVKKDIARLKTIELEQSRAEVK